MERWSDQPLYVIVGMLNTKDPEAFLSHLAPFTDALYAVEIEGQENSLAADALAATATALEIDAAASGGLDRAVTRIIRREEKPGRILICGSLYLAAHLLKQHR